MDVAYALLVEQLVDATRHEQSMVATFLAAGSKGVKMPELDDRRRDLDRALNERIDRTPLGSDAVLAVFGLR